jgi:hypothetical protein
MIGVAIIFIIVPIHSTLALIVNVVAGDHRQLQFMSTCKKRIEQASRVVVSLSGVLIGRK